MPLASQLAHYVKNGNLAGYINARYPAIPEGEEVIFENEDFTGVDFSPFVLGFMTFKNSTLDGATMQGQPITIIDSSAKNLNLVDKSAVIIAYGSDFRGLNYSTSTLLAKRENGDAGCSHFYHCAFDEAAKRYFARQGVVFKE